MRLIIYFFENRHFFLIKSFFLLILHKVQHFFPTTTKVFNADRCCSNSPIINVPLSNRESLFERVIFFNFSKIFNNYLKTFLIISFYICLVESVYQIGSTNLDD